MIAKAICDAAKIEMPEDEKDILFVLHSKLEEYLETSKDYSFFEGVFATFEIISDIGSLYTLSDLLKSSSFFGTPSIWGPSCYFGNSKESIFFVPPTPVINQAIILEDIWTNACLAAEKAYFDFIKKGSNMALAYSVLPLSVRGKMVVSMGLCGWMFLFSQMFCLKDNLAVIRQEAAHVCAHSISPIIFGRYCTKNEE